MRTKLDDRVTAFEVACDGLYDAIKEIVKDNAGFLRLTTEHKCTAFVLDDFTESAQERDVYALGVFCNDLCIMCDSIDGMEDAQIVESDYWISLNYNTIECITLEQIALSLQIMGL